MKSKDNGIDRSKSEGSAEKTPVQIRAGPLQEVRLFAEKLLQWDSISKRKIESASSDLRKILLKYYRKKQVYNIQPDFRIWQSVSELKAFIRGVSNPRFKLIFKLLAWTGIRQNELLRLRVKDIDFKNETIYVKITKNADVIIPKPLPSKLCQELKWYVEYFRPEDYLFKTCSNAIRRYFREYCDKLGGKYNKCYAKSTNGKELRYFSVHSFRKWYATLIDSNGFGHFAINDTRATADKHYIGKLERIRKIVNELY